MWPGVVALITVGIIQPLSEIQELCIEDILDYCASENNYCGDCPHIKICHFLWDTRIEIKDHRRKRRV